MSQTVAREQILRAQAVNGNGGSNSAFAGGCEEIEVDRGDVSLCLLVNRRTSSMRVIDFRAGLQPRKLEMIQKVAQEEGIQRAFTVVEREESITWGKMGFTKEGSIPGFYKRSDAYVLGMDLSQQQPFESGTRIRIAAATPHSPDRAERAYQAGRRYMRSRAPESLPRVKVARPRQQDIDKAFAHAEAAGRTLSHLEGFGRDVDSQPRLCTARGGFSLLVGVEIQTCFDNAFLEALVAPRGDKETWLTAAGLTQICDQLKEQEISSVFALSPAESVELTAAYVKAGFRKTGCLPGHLRIGGASADGFVWSRRLAEAP